MLRFGINRFLCWNTPRSLLASSTRSVQQSVNKSTFAYTSSKILQHPRICTVNFDPNSNRIAYPIRGVKTLTDESSKETDNLSDDLDHQDIDEEITKAPQISTLERTFARFEQRCQRSERVLGKNFAAVFDIMTKFVENIEKVNGMTPQIQTSLSLLTAILLRCCGKLMDDTPEKARELLAGNIWEFIKEKKIPIDISHYNSLIRVLNENETNFDPQKMLDEIINANLKPDRVTYQRLIHQYCVQGNINGATSLLEKMKELGMELNELTFASLIIGYGKQDNPPSMDEMFELMKSNGIELSGRTYTAAIISLVNQLEKNPAIEEELKKIYELVESDEIRFNVNEVVDIVKALSRHRTNETVAKIYAFACNSFSTPGHMNSRFRLFNALFAIQDHKKASELYWSIRPPQKAIEESNLGTYFIRLLTAYKHTPMEFVMEECKRFKESGYNNKVFYHLYFFAAQNGNLDIVRKAIEKLSQEEEVGCHYYWPLIAQAKDEKELFNVLKNDLNPNMRTQDLIDTFATWVWPRFENNISGLFDLNKELRYPNSLLITSLFTYSVQANKAEEAIKFVSEAPQELIESSTSDDQNEERIDSGLDSRKQAQRPRRRSLIGNLLRQISEETKDPAIVNRIFSLCKIPGQQLPASNCSPLVRVHLLNNDFKAALDKFFEVVQEYRVSPCKAELIQICLEQKDQENLQRIMDVSTELHGETNSLFDLAICCLRIGKVKQAQKILSNPGMRVNPMRVYQTAQTLGRERKIDVLEKFVHLVRDMDDINQENLYQILINVYETTSNGNRALDLWNRMQEEEFSPSRRSLAMLARVLERNNIEVPFQRPR